MQEGTVNKACIVILLFHHRILSVSEEMPLQIQSESFLFFYICNRTDFLPLLFVFVKPKTDLFSLFPSYF